MKKIMVCFLVAILMTSIISVSDAGYSSTQVVKSRHKIEVISLDQLPAGVVPKRFSTQAEADEYIDHLNAEIAELNRQNLAAMRRTELFRNNENDIISPLASTGTVSKTKDFNQCAGLHYVRMRVGMTWVQTGSYKTVQSVDSVTTNNLGWTADSKWSQSSSTIKIIDLRRTATVTVIGIMKHYLFVEDLVEITSAELTLYGEFRP